MLVHMSTYLEVWLSRNRADVRFLFSSGRGDITAPKNLNQTYVNRLKTVVFQNEEFQTLEDQMGAEGDRKGFGGHSLRKFASTEAKMKGATHDQVEYRGRWIGAKTKSVCATRYGSVEDRYTDGSVASLLCEGGGCCIRDG
jgi:hypothetical protein